MPPDVETLGEALARQYAEHGLPQDGGESDPWFRVYIGPLSFRLPNPPARKRAVFFHDANHVLTGYDTVFSNGEMVIAGFEVGSGCGPYWVAWFINLNMFAFGLCVCPRKLFQAFVRGRQSTSMYGRREDRAALSAMTVSEVRSLIGLNDKPLRAKTADQFAFGRWAAIALLTIAIPIAALLAAVQLAITSLRI